jgi:hypothetical protein
MGTLIFFTAAMIHANNTVRSCGNGGTYTVVPPLPHDLADLNAQIIAAVKNVNAPILMCVWQELEYLHQNTGIIFNLVYKDIKKLLQ